MSGTAYTAAASGNWSATGTWSPSGVPGTDPADTITSLAGYTVTVDTSPTLTSIAFSTGYLYCTSTRTITLSGNPGLTYSGTDVAHGGVQVYSGGVLTIAGPGSGTLISITGSGWGIYVSGTGRINLTNSGGTALNWTGSSRGLYLSSTSPSFSTIFGNVTGPTATVNNGALLYIDYGKLLLDGNLSCGSNGTPSGTYAVELVTGTTSFQWGTGTSKTYTLATGLECYIYIWSGTHTLTLTGVTLNNSGSFTIRNSVVGTTFNRSNFSVVNQTAVGQAACFGMTAFTVTGPTVPAATDVRSGVARGYPNDSGAAVSGGGNVAGSLVGVIDSGGTQHNYGTCSSTQAWAASGIIYSSGTSASTGILKDSTHYYATGIFDGTNYNANGTLYGNTGSNGTYHATGIVYGTGTYSYQATTGLSTSQVLSTVTTWYDGDGTHAGNYYAITQADARAKGGGYYGVGQATDGTCNVPSPNYVLFPVTIDATYGLLTMPSGADVQADADKFGIPGSLTTPTYPTTATTQSADATVISNKLVNTNNTDTSVTMGASTAYIRSQAAYGTIYAAAQSADASTLTAKTLNADGTDTTVGFGASNGTAKSGAVFTAGQSNQYTTDQADATAKKMHLDNNYSIAGITGSLDMSTYVLKSAVVDKSHVDSLYENWTGNGYGSIVMANYVLKSAVVAKAHVDSNYENWTGNGYGTLDLSNLVVGNIKSGVTIAGVGPGTFTHTSDYTLTSGIVWPTQAHVNAVETAWGPTGAEYHGTLDMTLYDFKSNYTDPGKAYVLTGHNYTYAGVSQTAAYAGGGTDPTNLLKIGDAVESGVFVKRSGSSTPATYGCTLQSGVIVGAE